MVLNAVSWERVSVAELEVWPELEAGWLFMNICFQTCTSVCPWPLRVPSSSNYSVIVSCIIFFSIMTEGHQNCFTDFWKSWGQESSNLQLLKESFKEISQMKKGLLSKQLWKWNHVFEQIYINKELSIFLLLIL